MQDVHGWEAFLRTLNVSCSSPPCTSPPSSPPTGPGGGGRWDWTSGAEEFITASVSVGGLVLDWLRTNPGWYLVLDNVDSEEAAAAVEEEMLAELSGARQALPLDVLS